jgi:hypothetical protein
MMTVTTLGQLAAKLGRDLAKAAFPQPVVTLTASGAIPIGVDGTYVISVAGAPAAMTVAAPGADNVGREITLLTGTDFAHVTTFTGATLQDGTAGANSTWTAAAVQGCALTFVAVSATKWNVKSFNLGTIAP